MLGVLIFGFFILSVLLSPFAWYQIITKAGYSGWWTFVPFSPIIAGLCMGFMNRATITAGESVNSILSAEATSFVVLLLAWSFTIVMFFVFAFSSWPNMRAVAPQFSAVRGSPAYAAAAVGARAGHARAGGAPPMPTQPAQAPTEAGWYPSGPVGAGEQSYWDGTEWTAQRKWAKDQWVDLPPPAFPADGPEEG